MRDLTDIYVTFVCYDPKIQEPKVIKNNIFIALEIAVLEARIDERKLAIYTLESDLMDHAHSDDAYSKDYISALNDEIKGHKDFIIDYQEQVNKILK